MKFNELTKVPKKQGKRLGRGIAAGQGKTAGRGTKGQKSRTGSKKKPGFQGGTNPLMQQLPKLPGFKSHKPKAANVHTADLVALKAKTIDAQALADAGLVENPFQKIKLLNNSEKLSVKLAVKLPGASQTAIDNIQQAGGSFEKVTVLQRESQTKEEK
ncbi:MAG TPA: 50S ribosomal protein L15 [Candidatus Saccharimonadales bacterium]